MTSDFDELASAYLDGQISDEERARVEADPELQDTVAELQAVSQALNVDVPPADELLRGRQIGAALDAFDALRGEPDEREATATIERTRPAPVDLAERRSTRQAPARSRNGLPPWLGIAAVLLLIVGGVGLLTQLDGDDDDAAETAADSFDDSDDGERGSDDEATEEVAVADEERATEAPAAAESAQTQQADGDAGGDEEASDEAESEGEDASEGDDAGADTTSPAASLTSTTAVGGFFPEEQIDSARVTFDEIPTDEELFAAAAGPRFAPEAAACTELVAEEIGVEIDFFVPIAVAGVDGEALFSGPPSDLAVLLLDRNCEPFG